MAEEMPQDLSMDMQSMSAPESTAQDFDMNAVLDGGPKQNYAVTLQDKPTAASSPSNNVDDFTKAMSQSIDDSTNEIFRDRDQPKTLQEKLNRIDGPKVRYTTDDAVDIYRYQDGFDPEGFDPFNSKNYQHWTEKENWSSALGKAMDSFATRFGNTYTDNFASYGRMVDALFSWDWDKMNVDADEMDELNWAEYKESMKNFVFIDPSEEEDIISKRSVVEFMGNAGYALGTMGALTTELVADAALTYFTGGAGAGSFAATAAKFTGIQAMKAAAKQGIKSMGLKGMAKVGDFIGDVGKGAFRYANESAEALSGGANIGNKIRQAETLADAGKIGSAAFRDSAKEVFDIMSWNFRNILKSKSFDQLAMNIAKGVPLVGTGIRYGEKIVAGAKGGLSTGKLVGIGLQGTRRIAQELNMSSTEAGFEAVTTYGSTLDLMIKNHEAQNEGKPITGEEFAKMQEKAWQSASANYNTNLALLMATNRIQFGGLFNRFTRGSKWANDLLTEGAEKAFTVNRAFKSSSLLAQTYQKGFFGTYGLTGKIAKDFGKKQAAYEFGKQFLKDATKFQVSEGLQENLQETSASAWMNYYAGQYNGTKYTLAQAFDKGINEQFTKQGLRTFLQGALTGVLIGPAAKIQQFSLDKIQEATYKSQYKENPSANPYVRMKEQLAKDIDLQNQFFNQISNKKHYDNIVRFTSHVDNTLQQTEAAARNAQYEWQNGQDNIVLAGALAANRTGTIAAYRQAIKDMGKDMSDEEFETAFGIKLEDTKYSSAAEFANEMSKEVGKYSDMIDKVRKKAKTLPDPMMYEQGSKEQLTAIILNNAQEEAIKIIALNQMKGMRAGERATKLTQDLMSIPGFESSSDYAVRVLTNPDNFRGEIGNIQAEIRLLQEGMETATPEMKKDLEEKIKLKKRKLELLDKWLNYWNQEEVEEERIDTKTNETVKRKTNKYTSFKGVEQKVVEKDEDGNVTNPNGVVYQLDHEDVRETFREFINIVNKEAGIKTQLTEQALFDGIDKIVDYMRLDKDSKDYLKSVDVLFNPDNYRQLIGRMQDGILKYELLEFVDSINDKLRGSIAFAVRTTFNEDSDFLESISQLQKITEKITKELREFDAYKNLITVVTSEEFGINSSKFVMENMKRVQDFLLAKMAEIYDNYAAMELTEDIDDETYSNFKQTGNIPEINLNIIARKLTKREMLTSREGEVYDKYKNDIIEIKKFIDESMEVLTTETSQELISNQSLIDALKQKLVETNEFTMENLDVLPSSQIYDMAFERGLITVDELSFGSTNKDVIPDDIDINNVPDNILRSISSKDAMGLPLSDREEEILNIYRERITEIQNEEQQELDPNAEEETEEEENAPETTPEVEETVEQQPEEVAPTTSSSPEEATANIIDSGDALLMAAGYGIEAQVTGDEENGHNVTAPNGTELSNEPLPLEKAEEVKEKFDTAFDNVTWATNFLQTDDVQTLDRFIKMATASMKSAKTEAKTLEEYSKTPKGRGALNEAKEAALAGFTTLGSYRSSEKGPAKVEGTPVELFDTTTSVVSGPAIPMSALESLHAELQSMSQKTTLTTEERRNKSTEIYGIKPNLRDDVGYYGMYYAPNGEQVMVQGADYNDVTRKLNEMYDNESSPIANALRSVLDFVRISQDGSKYTITVAPGVRLSKLNLGLLENTLKSNGINASVNINSQFGVLEIITSTAEQKSNITPAEFKELTRLAKFFLENPKEPTVKGSVVTRYPELFKAITDIEKRREERIKKAESKFWVNNEKAYLDFVDELGGNELKAFKNKDEIINYLKQRIETKYKAELATLEAQPVATEQKSNIEQEIQDVLNAQNKEELIKAAETLIGINPYDSGAVSMGTRSALMTPGSFERGKQLFIDEIKGSIEQKRKAESSATKVSGKIDTFVEKGDVSEQSIFDALDDIHSCF